MARFVPKGKMSKKARKELDRQKRVTWRFSPVTKTVESKKLYNRKKNSCDRHEDYGTGVFQFPERGLTLRLEQVAQFPAVEKVVDQLVVFGP